MPVAGLGEIELHDRGDGECQWVQAVHALPKERTCGAKGAGVDTVTMPPTPAREMSPATTGTLLALGAAIAFGLVTPLIEWCGSGAGPFACAAVLYAGAALASFWRPVRPALKARELRILLAMGLVGAALAPALFTWGVQRTGSVTASLALEFEVIFSLVLARVIFHERIGARVLLAIVLTLVGGALLALNGAGELVVFLPGLLAVIAATLAWAIDNMLSRTLAELDVGTVVAGKGLIGAVVTSSLAVATHQRWPTGWRFAVLLAAGTAGYGASLRLYLLAQRHVGAARTASIFSVAPFIGALVGAAFGSALGGLSLLLGAGAFAISVALLATERHLHAHHHHSLEHSHAHRHDDGHHSHSHQGEPPVEHTHAHAHEPQEHSHEHADDLHHQHEH